MSLELDTSKWFHIFYLVNEISKTKDPIGPLKIFLEMIKILLPRPFGSLFLLISLGKKEIYAKFD